MEHTDFYYKGSTKIGKTEGRGKQIRQVAVALLKDFGGAWPEMIYPDSDKIILVPGGETSAAASSIPISMAPPTGFGRSCRRWCVGMPDTPVQSSFS